MTTIAVLLTCHNRKEKTLQCLKSLYEADLSSEYVMEVFLVDDGSTDGTSEAVKMLFPEVNVIRGDGHLFWNQGMRLAWKVATRTKDFNFYFWLNDDTILDKIALKHLLTLYNEITKKENNPVLLTSACRTKKESLEFAYGGRDENGPVIPNGKLQACKYINGNAVLVPKEIFMKIGNLSNDYTHGMGDFDYGLRALKNGYKCYTTREYVATCHPNKGVPAWCNPEVPLKKRWQLLHSPRGLNLPEYIIFRKKFWGKSWRIFALKAYAKTLSPKLYSTISN